MRKRLSLGVIIVFFLAVIPLISAANETNNVVTSVDIPNSPPSLLMPIPNQSWPLNTNLINVFDLDDYFTDVEGDTVTYSYSGNQNITISINSLNVVSFYPDSGFSGTEIVYFYGHDNSTHSSSNPVYLNVGVDDEPPQWSSPSKNKATVYQNSYVNFTTLWTDNLGLASYVFSIEQGSWTNYTGTFTGLQNTSEYRVQISASSGSVVSWMFCALDTSNNFNCTDVQSFNVTARTTTNPPAPTPSPSGGGGGGAGGWFSSITGKKIENFSLNPESFKVSLKQGTTETRVLEITNIGNTNISFSLSLTGVDEFALLSEEEFSLSGGESKRITIDFTASKDLSPDQYFGELVVDSSSGSRSVPIVLDVNLLDLQFEVDVTIPEEYKRVKPGRPVTAGISIKNLKDIVATNLTFYVALKDIYGNIYDSSEEFILFSNSLDLEKTLTLPEDAREGEYLFYARAYNDKTIAIDSDYFEVGSRFNFAAFFRYSFFLILIIFLSILAIILALRYRHEKQKKKILSLYVMLNELKKLVKENKFDQAVELYIKIKAIYHEPVSKGVLENREKLKEEISKLANHPKLMQKIVQEKTGDLGVDKEKTDVKKDAADKKEKTPEKPKENADKKEVKKDAEKVKIQGKEVKKEVKPGEEISEKSSKPEEKTKEVKPKSEIKPAEVKKEVKEAKDEKK